MTTHPNRGADKPGRNPTPDEIRALRENANLSERDAARLVFVTASTWRRWEAGEKRMHPGLFALAKHLIQGTL